MEWTSENQNNNFMFAGNFILNTSMNISKNNFKSQINIFVLNQLILSDYIDSFHQYIFPFLYICYLFFYYCL